MIINREKEQEMISRMKIVDQVKYLGIIITDKRNYFKEHKNKKN